MVIGSPQYGVIKKSINENISEDQLIDLYGDKHIDINPIISIKKRNPLYEREEYYSNALNISTPEQVIEACEQIIKQRDETSKN